MKQECKSNRYLAKYGKWKYLFVNMLCRFRCGADVSALYFKRSCAVLTAVYMSLSHTNNQYKYRRRLQNGIISWLTDDYQWLNKREVANLWKKPRQSMETKIFMSYLTNIAVIFCAHQIPMHVNNSCCFGEFSQRPFMSQESCEFFQ